MELVLQEIRNLSNNIDERLSKIELDHFRHNKELNDKLSDKVETMQNDYNELQKQYSALQQKYNDDMNTKDGDIKAKDEKIFKLNEAVQKYIKETSNSCVKGRLFEQNIVQPQLQKLIDSIPNMKLDITRSISGQGDATIQESLNIDVSNNSGNYIKCNAEAKNYTDKCIRSTHIVQAVTNAINKNANCVLLIYNELPDYAGTMYDFGKDVKNIFPKDLNFDRNMCLACTPETIQFAFSILMCRFKPTNYTITCEKEEILNEFVKFMDEYVRFVNPFFSSYTMKKMEDYSRKIASLGAALIVDSSNVQNCDDKLKKMQATIRQIVKKVVSTKESENNKGSQFVPKLFGVYPDETLLHNNTDDGDRPNKRPREDML